MFNFLTASCIDFWILFVAFRAISFTRATIFIDSNVHNDYNRSVNQNEIKSLNHYNVDNGEIKIHRFHELLGHNGRIFFPGQNSSPRDLRVKVFSKRIQKIRKVPGEKINWENQNGPEALAERKLVLLRRYMLERKLDAYIVLSTDEHQNEYVNEFDKRREFISEFTGSAGTVIVTLDKALLWTDGRYHLQASQELNSQIWTLMKSGLGNTLNTTNWLRTNLKKGDTIGVYANVISYSLWKNYRDELEPTFIFLLVSEDLVDSIWNTLNKKEANKNNKIYLLPEKISGESWENKVERVRKRSINDNGDQQTCALLISELDDIAWLYNLRGDDIPYNPVFFAYSIITDSSIYLFINNIKLPQEVRDNLQRHCDDEDTKLCVKFLTYDEVYQFFPQHMNQFNIIKTPKSINMRIYSSIVISPNEENIKKASQNLVFLDYSPVKWMKIIKNPIEIEGMKQAQYRDSAALINAISFLEDEIENDREWDEISILPIYEYYRSKQKYFKGLSFEPISAVGPNSAVIHYSPKIETKRMITKQEIYLLDSGAQYLDGTTDVTRTFHFGSPTKFQKEVYTRVLMGSINLASLVFPNYITGRQVDTMSRQPLWEMGLDYRHGTGHGLGAFLNVHEGPIFIGVAGSLDVNFKHGMFLSDEPGFYKANDFGVRLETIVMVKNFTTKYNYSDQDYLAFESYTLVPFEPKLIDYSLLNCNQVKWIDDYNSNIKRYITPILIQQNGSRALMWMNKRIIPLEDIRIKKGCPD
ncbi:unnamed protein product [Gordionus sp. m RMFG-2023]|uniref:uncharacterized protein LOC135931613 n=1 Tax=Gordionus sp. m RMFG-2023 TaxID=3053472 RepID=UPI0030E5B326